MQFKNFLLAGMSLLALGGAVQICEYVVGSEYYGVSPGFVLCNGGSLLYACDPAGTGYWFLYFNCVGKCAASTISGIGYCLAPSSVKQAVPAVEDTYMAGVRYSVITAYTAPTGTGVVTLSTASTQSGGPIATTV